MTACGSWGGYLRHYKRKETPCRGCLDAIGLDPCGTTGAYKRHLKHKEPTCQPCRDANAASKQRGTYAYVYVRSLTFNPASVIIVDYVETFTRVTIIELAGLIQEQHPISFSTLQRAVFRMLRDGRLSSEKDCEGRLLLEVA